MRNQDVLSKFSVWKAAVDNDEDSRQKVVNGPHSHVLAGVIDKQSLINTVRLII